MQNYPIIVLDGPDGAGKTTLANELAKQSDGHVMHLTYRFKDRMHQYHTAALELALKRSTHQPVIIDRWWPSEKVYADVFRGGSSWPLMGRMLDRVALKHAVLYVFCQPEPKSQYLEHFEQLKADRVEMYDTMDKVWDAFEEAISAPWNRPHRDDISTYDYNQHRSKDEFEAYAKLLIRTASQRVQNLPAYAREDDRSIAGNLRKPKVVLVGQRSNPKGRRQVWPFFEYANSSLWLTEALAKFDIREYDLAWINAQKADGSSNAQLIYDIADRSVPRVPFGQIALNICEMEAGLECRLALKHPSHSKRFSPNDYTGIQRLAELIKAQPS